MRKPPHTGGLLGWGLMGKVIDFPRLTSRHTGSNRIIDGLRMARNIFLSSGLQAFCTDLGRFARITLFFSIFFGPVPALSGPMIAALALALLAIGAIRVRPWTRAM